MLALGVTLLVSVAATPPPATAARPATEKLVSTYDDASCDATDGGECADEVLVELSIPSPPAILDCESPFIEEMIGSCDLPTPMLPSLHLPTLRNAGSGFSASRDGSTEHLTVINAASSVEAALPIALAFAPSLRSTPLFGLHDTTAQEVAPARLDRPPRS